MAHTAGCLGGGGGGGGGGGEGEETNKGRLRGKGILDVSWIGSVKTVSKS